MNINATILGQVIAFILFVFFCMKYVWPPLIGAIEKRQREIADSLASVEYAKKNLDLAKDEAVNHLKQAKLKAQAIIEQARKNKIQIINTAKNEAATVRNNILAQAKMEIYAERKLVYEELCTHIAALSLACAEKIIEGSINETTNSDFINKIIPKL